MVVVLAAVAMPCLLQKTGNRSKNGAAMATAGVEVALESAGNTVVTTMLLNYIKRQISTSNSKNNCSTHVVTATATARCIEHLRQSQLQICKKT